MLPDALVTYVPDCTENHSPEVKVTTARDPSARESRLDVFAATLSGALVLGTGVAIVRILAGSWQAALAPVAAVLTVFVLSAIYLRLKQRFAWPHTTGELDVVLLAWFAGGLVWDQLEPPDGSVLSHSTLLLSVGVIAAGREYLARRRQGQHRSAAS